MGNVFLFACCLVNGFLHVCLAGEGVPFILYDISGNDANDHILRSVLGNSAIDPMDYSDLLGKISTCLQAVMAVLAIGGVMILTRYILSKWRRR